MIIAPAARALLIGLLFFEYTASFATAEQATEPPDEEPIAKLESSGEPIPIAIGVKLHQLTSINQKAENFTAVVRLTMRYKQPELSFRPDSGEPPFRMYEVPAFLKLVQSKGLYWPEYIVVNQQGRRDVTTDLVTLEPDGEVLYASQSTMTFQAPDFDFRRFPFDHQVFHIRIRTVLPEDIYVYQPMERASGLGDQLGEEEWIVYDQSTEVISHKNDFGYIQSEFVFSFQAHRHLIYYLVRIFVPMLIILVVSWFTFQLKDYVKRIDVGITNLLLFIAFNFTVSSDLPRLGYITAMDAFMTGAFVITGAVLLVNVVLRRLQTSGREETAARFDRYAIWAYWPAYVAGMSVALLVL